MQAGRIACRWLGAATSVGARRAAPGTWKLESKEASSSAHATDRVSALIAASGERETQQLFGLFAVACGSVFVLGHDQRSRSLRCASLKRVSLGRASDFEDGSMQQVVVGPEGTSSVLLHRHQGSFYATSPFCSHYGAPLKKGVSAGGGRGGAPTVSCSLHDATFDLKTGMPLRGPGLDGIATYTVEVKDGEVLVYLPPEVVSGETKKHAVPPVPVGKRDPADTRVFAVVGGGAAAMGAVETLRQEGFGGRVVVFSKEEALPYDRVQLSKNLDKTAGDLQLRPASFFEQRDIEFMLGSTVTSVDARGQKLKYTTRDGREEALNYDKVLVASGGHPRNLFVPGGSMKGIHTLRTPEDAFKIASLAKKGQKFIVVGGSFIGMEVASSLRKRGCDVAVVAMETVPFERVLGKKIGASFARLLQKEGVQWFGSSQVRLFRGNENVNGVELEDGEVLPADGVVVGAGVLPNTRFVDGVSMDKNGAIVVNPFLCSEAAPTLYAAGDVCTFPSVSTGTHVRIEHWDVALQQGRVAARNMLDKFQPFTATPFFWSSLFGKNLRFVGQAPDMLDRVIVEGDTSNMEFISYYVEGNEIRAVATVNRDPRCCGMR